MTEPSVLAATNRRALGWPCLAGGLALLVSCRVVEAPKPPQPRVEHWQAVAGTEYLEVIPTGPGAQARLPMVVFVHGMGDRPQAAWIDDDAPAARYIMPRAYAPYGEGFSWFTYRVGTQHPGLAHDIETATARLAALLRRLKRDKPTRGRIILSGFSQGGILSLALSLRYPDLFEIAHPVAGWLPRSLWPAAPQPDVRPVPIRAAHGTADRVIPLAPTREMVNILAARGFDIRLKTFEGVGHTQSPPMKRMMDTLVEQGITSASR